MKLGKEFGPSGLAVGQKFGCREVLQIFVVGDNINRSTRTFKVMPPFLESLENG